MSVGPSTTPESQPAPVALRVHRMRVARGACWVIVAALLGVAVLTLVDAVAWLPGWARGLGLAVWFTTIGVMAWRLVVNRLQPDASDGPTPLPREELPGNLSAAVAAALALAGSLAAASFVPGAGEHLKRVAIPWSRPAAAHYRIVVTSGEPVVRRGGAVTLSAYVDKLDPTTPVPSTATLVCRERAGTESRLPMIGDGNGVFHATRTATTDFEYHVEIDHAASDWHTVFTLEPAELADHSSIEVTPPRYVPAATRQTIPGFAPFESFQFGTAEFRLRFTHPVATAFLEWRTEGGGPVEVTKLDLGTDRLSGSATLRLKQDGTLKLVTVVESNGKTLRHEMTARVRVTPDTPPRFERITGVSPRPRTARPGTSVPITFTAADDIAIGSAVLEYVVGENNARPVAVPILLTGDARADGRLDFDLSGKAHAGEVIRFRLRIADTRRLDDPELKPQEAVYPESGWSVIRLDPTAPPLDEQDWFAQRDILRDALRAALDEVKESREDAEDVRRASTGKSSLTHDQRVRLTNARDHLQTVANQLRDTARNAALTPELQALALRLRELTDTTLRKVGESLDRAATDQPADLAAALSAVVDSLTESAQRIEQLLAHNEQLAQGRLDRKVIGSLAADQAELTRAAESLPPKELATRQRELLTRLQKLVVESGALHAAADRARHQEFRRLAATAAQLATRLRDHDAAVRQLDTDVRRSLLRTITADQTALATQAAALLAKIETPARLAGIDTPKAEPFARAAELIDAGNAIPTLVELESLAQKLEAVATAFDKSAAERADAKAAVRQLAAWQNDLRTRFRAATSGNAANFNALPPATKAAIRTEQAAIRAALAALSLPPGSDTRTARETALKHLSAAVTFLAGTGASADDAMRFSGETLGRLAEAVPTISERLTRARTEFARFQQSQDSILVEFEQATRGADAARKLPTLAERQRQQVSAFAALDLPGLDARRARIASALALAAADMKDGAVADSVATQAWIKREMERLKLALDGSPPQDDRVDELARRLNEVAKALAALGANPSTKQLEPHAATVADVGRLWEQTTPPEAPALFNEADRAVRAAVVAFRENNLKPAELLRRASSAAEAVAKLADRLSGAESDLDRVRRLASNRRAAVAVEEARRATMKQPDPAASDEMVRQLGREIDELTHTRVGFAAQARKKRVLDQYTRLKEQMFPERQIGVHRALAESLDELAALMADVPELTATFDRTPPAPTPTDADAFLPSKPLADALRDLARRQRAIRASIIGVPAAVRERTKPADATTKLAPDDPRAVAAQLKVQGEELARSTAELAAQLEAAAQTADADRNSREILLNAIKLVKSAEKDIADANRKSAAVDALRTGAEKLATLAPKEAVPDADPAAARAAEALRRADSAMRQALASLREKPDRVALEKAMRTAADALDAAVKARVEVASDRK